MKPGWIARQSRRPSGWIGEVVARVMARETRAANAFAMGHLPLAPGDAVLEIGCGHGQTLARLAERVAGGFAAGIDPSDVMVRLATRRLRRAIARGRAAVERAEASRLPFPDARFDAALAVHVLPFWPDPTRELREIRRVLRPGGLLVLGFRPDGPEARASLPASVYHLRPASEVAALLREAGFEVLDAREPRIQGMPFACLEARAAALGGRDATPTRDGCRD
jgi:ubiquinone/menaquinone biosynthesis C-methylase UbiE